MTTQSSPVYQTDTRTGETVRIDNVTRVAAPSEERAVRRVDAGSSGSAESVLRSRALEVCEAVATWMPVMDSVDKRSANAIRALRDVCGWKMRKPNSKLSHATNDDRNQK